MIQFEVHGVPAPQGSKTPWGTESNPGTRPWRAAVTAEAARAMLGESLLLGPVAVHAEFHFTRPKHHYGTGKNDGVLKPSAPRYLASKPDGDKLARAIGDALTGIVFRDDAQIAEWTIVKLYADQASAWIAVWHLAFGGLVAARPTEAVA